MFLVKGNSPLLQKMP